MEELPLDLSSLEYMHREFPEVKEKEEMRKIIGRYGLSGREQVIYNLIFSLCINIFFNFCFILWESFF